ncbi:MAG: hypothetical protein ACSHWY_02305 [Octadecabacter sp.]
MSKQNEIIEALNAKLKPDSGKFLTVKGVGHRLVAQTSFPDLPGYSFGYRSFSLFHIPMSKSIICLLSSNEGGGTNVHGWLSKDEFLEIFGAPHLAEMNKSFAKEVKSVLIISLVVAAILGGLLLLLFR